ncbi:MAG: hypothetical protein ACHQ49_07990 [Elusimicrobiota bacterium]
MKTIHRLAALSLMLSCVAAALPARAQTAKDLSARVVEGIASGWCYEDGCRSIHQDLERYASYKAVVTETYVYIYGVVEKGQSAFAGTYFVVGIGDVNDGQLKNSGLGLKRVGAGFDDFVLVDHRNGDAIVAPADFVAAVQEAARDENEKRTLHKINSDWP